MEHLIKINLPGGIVSAGDLYEILLIAEDAGAQHVRFGNRQQLYFTINRDGLEDLETEMVRTGFRYEVDSDAYPNIVSSYVADTIFNQEGWLREGVYKDILDRFDYQPALKINFVDNQQSFVPFFSGNINFIASDTSNYWYMYIRFPKSGEQYCYPSLVYSEDIPSLAKAAGEIIFGNKKLFYDQKNADEQLFFKMLSKRSAVSFHKLDAHLKLPDFQLPYYEGFNKYNNRYWLGIYRRNELYSVGFLKDVCSLCLKTRIGQIYTTPWKSIIIKGIDPANRHEWGFLLSKYHLNVRHAANELNWQIEDMCEEGLELKKQLVREFEEADLRTYQLCFAIKTQPKTGLPGSVIIKKNNDGLYDLLHTRDFNPNSKDYVTYQQKLHPNQLSTSLIALCKGFCDLQSIITASPTVYYTDDAELKREEKDVYQCTNCLTRYDKTYGDDVNGIEKDVEFTSLTQYHCPVCEAPQLDFIKIKV